MRTPVRHIAMVLVSLPGTQAPQDLATPENGAVTEGARQPRGVQPFAAGLGSLDYCGYVVATGHTAGTGLPGELGHVEVSGHRDTVFYPPRNIRAEDVEMVAAGTREYRRRLVLVNIVRPEDSGVLDAGERQVRTSGPAIHLPLLVPHRKNTSFGLRGSFERSF